MTVLTIISKISEIFGAILPILVSFGVLYFVYGVIRYMIADSEEAKTKGRDTIIYGVIGLAVIVSLWGLVGVINSTFGLGGENGLTVGGAPSNVSNLVAGGSGACAVGGTFPELLKYFTCIIGSSIIPFLFAVAVLMFVWGAIKFFIIEADEESKREQGRQFMIWGIIALAVMISVWGLVAVLADTFGIKKDWLPQVTPPGQNK